MDHLPAQEAKHVINLLSGLFLYAYRTKNKKAKVTMDNMEHLCHVGSTILFRNEQASRRLIEQYLRLHPQLPKEDAACIARFQGCRKQQLYVMQYEQEYTFVMDRKGKTLYGVKGITDSLSFLLRNQKFLGFFGWYNPSQVTRSAAVDAAYITIDVNISLNITTPPFTL